MPDEDEDLVRELTERTPTIFSVAIAQAKILTKLGNLSERVKRIENALIAIAGTALLALLGAVIKLVIK